MAEPTGIWRSRPIFISSTFRDMHAERDYLRDFVFPELDERLRDRRCYLEPVDLRWGVETVSVDDQEAKELLVLKVCLSEIERSRPFLLVLLGDRYGWVPPEERIRAAASEAGFDTDVSGKSVTALEIEYGALTVPDQLHRTFFYFREPLPYAEMDRETAGHFSDEHSDNAVGKENQAKLAALKSRIEQQMPDRVRHYHVGWDPARKVITGLEDFGKLVLENLWSALDEETRAFVVPVTSDWREQESWLLEQFVEERSRDFIGREEATERAIEFALSEESSDKKILCFAGEPGAGKSSFFAHLYRELRSNDVLLLANATGTSPDSVQIDRVLQRWANEVSGLLDVQFRVPEDTAGKELDEAFANLLHHASRQKKIVLLVDALNQFSPSVRTSHVTWLQRLLPDNVRVIVTSTRGIELEALESRTDSEIVLLGGMTADEYERVAQSLCRRYHRTPHTEVIGVLLEKMKSDPAVAGNPLWLTLAVGELNLLDEDDFARAERDFAGTSEERLHQLMLSTAASFPADVQSLYAGILDGAERVHGESWVKGFVNLIAASRYGWRESDLRALTPVVSGEQWSDLRFATLRRNVRTQVAQRGALAQWDFCHVQFRETVLSRNLPDERQRERLHGLVADYLEPLPHDDLMRENELMFHYIHANDKLRAARLYSDPSLSATEIGCATASLADHIASSQPASEFPGWQIQLVKRDESSGDVMDRVALEPTRQLTKAVEWVVGLVGDGSLTSEAKYLLCNRLGTLVAGSLRNKSRLSLQLTFLELTEQSLTAMLVSSPPRRDRLEFLFGLKLGIASLLEGQRSEEALPAYQSARAVLDSLVSQHPDDTGLLQQSSVLLLRLAKLLQKCDDWTSAHICLKESGEIAMRLCQRSDEYRPLLCECVVALASAFYRKEDWDEAVSGFRCALSEVRKLCEREPDSPGLADTLCTCLANTGAALLNLGNAEESIRYLDGARSVAQSWSEMEPDQPMWLETLSGVLSNMACARMATADPKSAFGALSQALTVSERIWKRDPGDASAMQQYLNCCHNMVHLLHTLVTEFGLDLSTDELRLLVVLCAQLGSDTAWVKLSVCCDKLGQRALSRGNCATAQELYQKSVHAIEALQNGDNRLSLLYQTHREWGDTCETHGFFDKAFESFQSALSITEQARLGSPDDPGWNRAFVSCYRRLADVLLAKGDLDAALENYRKVLLSQQEVIGAPEASQYFDYWVCHSRIGDVLSRMGQVENAIASYSTAAEIASAQSASSPDDESWQRSLAVSLSNLSRAYESGSRLEDASRCRHECLAVLRRLKEQCQDLDPWANQRLTELKAELPDGITDKETESHDID